VIVLYNGVLEQFANNMIATTILAKAITNNLKVNPFQLAQLIPCKA
jgi:hypothetical protein